MREKKNYLIRYSRYADEDLVINMRNKIEIRRSLKNRTYTYIEKTSCILVFNMDTLKPSKEYYIKLGDRFDTILKAFEDIENDVFLRHIQANAEVNVRDVEELFIRRDSGYSAILDCLTIIWHSKITCTEIKYMGKDYGPDAESRVFLTYLPTKW